MSPSALMSSCASTARTIRWTARFRQFESHDVAQGHVPHAAKPHECLVVGERPTGVEFGRGGTCGLRMNEIHSCLAMRRNTRLDQHGLSVRPRDGRGGPQADQHDIFAAAQGAIDRHHVTCPLAAHVDRDGTGEWLVREIRELQSHIRRGMGWRVAHGHRKNRLADVDVAQAGGRDYRRQPLVRATTVARSPSFQTGGSEVGRSES